MQRFMQPTKDRQGSEVRSDFSQHFCNAGILPNTKHRKKNIRSHPENKVAEMYGGRMQVEWLCEAEETKQE